MRDNRAGFKNFPTDRNNPTDKKFVIRWVVSIRWENLCFFCKESTFKKLKIRKATTMLKKALLVGINEYPAADDRLYGCVNDVRAMQEVLMEIFDFSTDHLKILLNREATKKNIVAGLKWLSQGGSEPAVRVFHYAGHGHPLPDTSGDEKDGQDEALAPYDYKPGVHKTFLIDDELRKLYKRFPAKSNLTLVMDCCHSGTNQRRDVERNRTFRSIPLTFEERRAIAQARRKFVDKRNKEIMRKVAAKLRGKKYTKRNLAALVGEMIQSYDKQPFGGDYNLREGNILLAACQPHEGATDTEIGNKSHGVFTYYLTQILRQTRGQIKYGELIQKVGAAFRDNRFDDQVPQLECNPGREKAKVLALF
jgi:hypothetical protein